MTPIHDSVSDQGAFQRTGTLVGTPSTVSTAPSSDDEGLVDYKLDETSTLPNLLHPIYHDAHTLGDEELLPASDSRSQEYQKQNPWLRPMRAHAHHEQQQHWDGVSSNLPQHHP